MYFFKALEFSNNEVEVVLGFMDSNDEILEDCFEESSNSITKLIEQHWIMNTIEIQKNKFNF